MSDEKWTVTFIIHRQKGPDSQPHFDEFTIEIHPEEFVLDGVEYIWAYKDRSLVFRHACHHTTCGACGMRVNGVEKLACMTKIADVTEDGGKIKLEPLRNFPIVGDLVVDLGPLYRKMHEVHAPEVIPLCASPWEGEGIKPPRETPKREDGEEYIRLPDCIECGLCVSACPTAASDVEYLGPAVLAAIHIQGIDENPDLLALADSREGVWRCHSAYECSAVCPSNVDPAWRIMDLRKQIIARRLKFKK